MPACPRPCRTCFTTASACARPPIPFSVRSLPPLSLASTTGTGHTRGRRTVLVEFKMSGWSSFVEEVRKTRVGGLERPHAWLLRLEVVLLRTDDAARANDAQPRYALVCRKPRCFISHRAISVPVRPRPASGKDRKGGGHKERACERERYKEKGRSGYGGLVRE